MTLSYAEPRALPRPRDRPCILHLFFISVYFAGPAGVSAALYYVCSHSPFPGTLPTWTLYAICCSGFEMTVTDGSLLVDCKHAGAWLC